MILIRVAFFKGPTKSLVSWAIRFWTASRFNHCEVILPDGRALRADGNLGVVWNAIPDSEAHLWDILTLSVTEEVLAELVTFATHEIGSGYDWRGIFLAQFLPLRREDPDRWFCSELCAAALSRAGVGLKRKPFAYSPGALHKEVKRYPGFS